MLKYVRKERFLLPLFVTSVILQVEGQRVGIGSSSPRAGLEIVSPSPIQLTITNPGNLTLGATTSLYFRNNGFYTAAIKSTGVSSASSRLGFFTFSSPDSADLSEKMTISNDGNVGIGTLNPEYALHVLGNGYFAVNGQLIPAVTGQNNTGVALTNIGVRGLSQGTGVLGQATANTGIGVLGYNLGVGGSLPPLSNGAGIVGVSRVGHGIFGRTTQSGFAGIFGSAYGNGTIGGWFSGGEADGFSNTLALRTSGSVRLTGIGEATGRVLTSDANGNATWNPLPPLAKGFSARLAGDINLVSGSEITVGNWIEIFDEGNIFSNGGNNFTAPETGMYLICFEAFLAQTNINSGLELFSKIFINGISTIAFGSNEAYPILGSGTWVHSHQNIKLVRLNVGDVITIKFLAKFLSGELTLRGSNFVSTTTLSIHQVK